MNKLSIAIDMGAKNNGVFIVKTNNSDIVEKKAENIIIDNINFSKKSRRENRHKDRNYKRRKLAKRLLIELINFNDFTKNQQESILGLLNNRGYTFLSTSSEFEKLNDETLQFNKKYLNSISDLKTKDDYEDFLTNKFEDEKELLEFLEKNIELIGITLNDLQNFMNKKNILNDLENLSKNIIIKFKSFSYIKTLLYKYGFKDLGKNQVEITKKLNTENIDLSKLDFNKEIMYINSLQFDEQFSNKEKSKVIIEDLKELKKLFINIQNEINTGSKPRKKYLKEIKDEINSFEFIKDKEAFFNLVGNISNLQLRVLRKFYARVLNDKEKYTILKKYFLAHHYKTENEKKRRKELFKILNSFDNLKEFLHNCKPENSIPPYEDMNNRDTYKCNSMLIKPSEITEDIKETIDYLLSKPEFEYLTTKFDTQTGGLETIRKVQYIKTKVIKDNQKVQEDFTYSKYLQRILDATEIITTKELNPRNVFKHKAKFEKGSVDSIESFKRVFGEKTYQSLNLIARKYYDEEEKILSGIYNESKSIFTKCNTNTPYKNNAKHILLKPIYSCEFTSEESDKFLEDIKNTKGLQTALQRVSEEAKKYQNSFYHIIEACFNDEKCIDDKDIKLIVKNIDNNLQVLKNILQDKKSYLNKIETVDTKNLKRVINIFKQTYEILFKELGGFNKTCKHCTQENATRSDETFTIAKRLLSDVAKPIDGMLDMMLDRVAFEITENILENDLKDINALEILLEQNRFEFEENLIAIKKKDNNQIKQKKREHKDKLNIDICPYTGKNIEKGDFDHILPQSKGVYNSKANMIYCSVEGNQKIKGNKDWSLELIKQNAPKHLKEIFKTDNLDEIKTLIKKGLDSINVNEFSNFDNLKLNQQVALRYALFMRETQEFNQAFEIVKKDKIKTFSNGTQKRLVRFINEKLAKKFSKEFKENDIKVSSKTIDSQLVRATRNYLANENQNLQKQEIQNSHSHCIDAMVVFYIANSKINGRADKKKDNLKSLEPLFTFDDIYLDESRINNLSKNRTFINSSKEELGSYKLFDDTIYSENYKHIKKDTLKIDELELLINHELLFLYEKEKKEFISNIDEIKENIVYKIDVQKVSNKVHELFLDRNSYDLAKLKFLDKLIYFTSRKEIENIFLNDKKTALRKFDEIKNIPYFSRNLYRAVYKKLQNEKKLFDITTDNKTILNNQVLVNILKNMFESKQKDEHKEKRKRGKKRHKFTLPILGSPKFKIKRENNTWQILGNKDIATKNYIINGNIKPIAYFTKNTIPVKIADLMDCLLINENTPSIYEVDVNCNQINSYVHSLIYFVSEAKRCTIEVSFLKSSFNDIDFNLIESFDAGKDELFKKFLLNYIENKELLLNKYLGSIRDGLKGKATLLDNNVQTITLQYRAAITSDKKQIILENIKN